MYTINKMMPRSIAIVLLACLAQADTVIQVKTDVLVTNVPRLGVNMDDNYYDMVNKNQRQTFNYEGLRTRQAHDGMIYSNGFLSFKVKLNWADSWFSNVYMGAKFRILSEPGRGIEGTIADVQELPVDIWNNGNVTTQAFFVFKQRLTNSAISASGNRKNGLLIEGTNLWDKGYIGTTNHYWNEGGGVALNDTHTNTWGNAAQRMHPGAKFVCMGIGSTVASVSGGVFRLSFYVKKDAGIPILRLTGCSNTNYVNPVPAAWEYREFIMTNRGEGVGMEIKESSGAGSLLIDDVVFEQLNQANDSYRDEMVELYRDELKIGIMRYVFMGGWSIEDQISPYNRMRNYKSAIGSEADVYLDTGYNSKIPINIPELCSASEAIGCIPWICISGTIYPDEMNTLIEFLAAPTNTVWGDFRAKWHNHPQPYTETLSEIIIEFGNEAWNLIEPYAAKGYNGPNYWNDCIAVAKSNMYFNSKIKLSTAGQNFSVGMANTILSNAPNSDLFAIAPYVMHDMSTNQMLLYDPTLEFATEETRKDLFRYFMSYPLYHVYSNGMPQQYVVSTNRGVPYTLYEYNYHFTGGDAPFSKRRMFSTSLAHGLSMANYGLAMLKEQQTRYQCFFNLMQRDYSGSFLWGEVLQPKKSIRSYRPVGYANMAMNKVRGGDLVQTVHTGDRPQFQVTGYFDSLIRTNRHDEIYSYAFRNNGTNGLILFNYGLDTTQRVSILLPDYVAGSTSVCWELSAPSFTNANEWAWTNNALGNVPSAQYGDLVPEPVKLTNYTVTGFSSGYSLDMKPCSMVVYQWKASGDFPALSLSSSAETVPENGTVPFDISLTFSPLSPVTVTVARVSGDTNITVQSGASLVFDSTNWDTPQTVTLAASEDGDIDVGTAVIRCSSYGMADAELIATEGENDLGILLSTGAVTVPEQSNVTFQVRLSMDPVSPATVTVARASGDTNITVSVGSSLVFNSDTWATWQTVTLAASDDVDMENGSAVIRGQITGVYTSTVQATEADNDYRLTLGSVFVEVLENGTNILQIKLAGRPDNPTTVTVFRVSGDMHLGVYGAHSVVFLPDEWSTWKTVTLQALNDFDQLDGQALFRCSLSPTVYTDVQAAEFDDDPVRLTLQADTYILYSNTANNAASTNLIAHYTSTAASGTRKAYLRFATTNLPSDMTGAALQLCASFVEYTAQPYTFEVWGLNNGHPGENWNPTTINWTNAPGHIPNIWTQMDTSASALIGTATFTAGKTNAGTLYTFTDATPGAFANFLAADTNGIVTVILLQKVSISTSRELFFAADEHTQYPPPRFSVFRDIVIPNYTLTVTANNPIWGSASPTSGTYQADSLVGIEALPKFRSSFVRWDCVPSDSSDPTLQSDVVLMDTNKTLTAIFTNSAAPWDPVITNGTPTAPAATRIVKFGIEWAKQGDGNTHSIGSYLRYKAARDATGFFKQAVSREIYRDFDVDGDGSVADDNVTAMTLDLSLTNTLTPIGPWYNTSAGSQRFVGGATIYMANRASASYSECGMNGGEEGAGYQPRRNWTLFNELYYRHSPFRMYALHVWPKEEFMNGGADYPVSFDANSELRHLVMRYFMGIEGFRWVVRNNEQFYISENIYRYAGDPAGSLGGKTHSCKPTEVRWAVYNPTGPYAIDFNTNGAVYDFRTFTNVTGVGHYLAKDRLITGYVGYKWYAFEADATVTRPVRPSENIHMVPVAGGASPNFYMSACEVPYELWRKVHSLARYNGFAGLPGFSFDSYGASGSAGFAATNNGAYLARHPDEPVTAVTFYDALAWCNALSQQEKRTPCYYTDATMTNVFREPQRSIHHKEYGAQPTLYVKWAADGYRLPTVSEWNQAWYPALTNTDYAWVASVSTGRSHQVGSRTTATNGFNDLAGNVWEPVWAWGDSVTTSQLSSITVLGGDFRYPQSPTSTSASAYGDLPFDRSEAIGLRLVRRESGLAAPSTSTNVAATVPRWEIARTATTAPNPARQLASPLSSNWLTIVSIPGATYDMAATEVTYAHWRPVYDWGVANGYTWDYRGNMGSIAYWGYETNDNRMFHTPQEPVTGISWYDAVAWCNALSELEGRTPAYYADTNLTAVYKNSFRFRPVQLTMAQLSATMDQFTNVNGVAVGYYCYWPDVYTNAAANGYRLASSNQFYYAARAGGASRGGTMDTGLVAIAWLADNSGFTTHEVATKPANAYGLYDMYGNVAELSETTTLTTGGDQGWRPRSGGSYLDIINGLFIGEGMKQSRGLPYPDVGFRVIRSKP